MKKMIISFILAATLSISLPIFAKKAPPSPLTNEELLSYIMGYQIGISLKHQPFKLRETLFLRGIQDASNGKQSIVDPKKAEEVITTYKQEITAKHETEMRALAAKNDAAATAFLTSNQKKLGIMTTQSGLQYQVIQEGSGQSPQATDTVTVHYRGTLMDGTEFDSSYARKEPMSIPVNAVIPGWTEALQKMKMRSKWKLFIPPKLAYGIKGSRGIPPNALLIFEVELLNIGIAKPKQ